MLLPAIALALFGGSVVAQFPFAGRHETASCQATNRATDETTTIDIHFVDVNSQAKDTLIFVHGWPSTWITWKHQIDEFKNDYRVIAVDVRGMGASGHPGDVEGSGTMGDLVDDLLCVLKHARVAGKPVCIGHDWGGNICWEAARSHPDIISGAVSLVVPYLAAVNPYAPIEVFLPAFPRLTYQVYFRDMLDTATAELEADIRRTIRIVYRHSDLPVVDGFLTSSTSFLAPYKGIDVARSLLMTDEEEDCLVDQFTKSGFKSGLQFYQRKNHYLSWKVAHASGIFNITVPSLVIYPTKDTVADWSVVSKMVKSKSFIPQLEKMSIPTAHWPHMERPGEVNTHIKDWLTRNFPSNDRTFQKAEGEL